MSKIRSILSFLPRIVGLVFVSWGFYLLLFFMAFVTIWGVITEREETSVEVVEKVVEVEKRVEVPVEVVVVKEVQVPVEVIKEVKVSGDIQTPSTPPETVIYNFLVGTFREHNNDMVKSVTLPIIWEDAIGGVGFARAYGATDVVWETNNIECSVEWCYISGNFRVVTYPRGQLPEDPFTMTFVLVNHNGKWKIAGFYSGDAPL